ncbi:MAG: M23 family metallopeptidase [Syntrophobacterales bacterium]|nr:M23 family metallopeptidase [Syntrophobacterales bacterium]
MAYLVAHNHTRLGDFKEWLFQPGMLFQSLEKWWGGGGLRPGHHEGLDLYSFADVRGRIKILDQHIRIPAAFSGRIVKIDPDFLGKSIFIKHEIFSGSGRQLYSAYGHTAPLEALTVGQTVVEGEIIAIISGGPGRKTAIAPHLHITFAWMPASLDPDRLTWENLGHDPAITLIDPLSVLSLGCGTGSVKS